MTARSNCQLKKPQGVWWKGDVDRTSPTEHKSCLASKETFTNPRQKRRLLPMGSCSGCVKLNPSAAHTPLRAKSPRNCLHPATSSPRRHLGGDKHTHARTHTNTRIHTLCLSHSLYRSSTYSYTVAVNALSKQGPQACTLDNWRHLYVGRSCRLRTPSVALVRPN